MKNKMKLPLLMVLGFFLGNCDVYAEENNSFSEQSFVAQDYQKEETPAHDEFEDSNFLDDLAADDSVKTVPHKEQPITYNLETVQLAALYVWHVYVVNSYYSCKNWIINFLKPPFFKPRSVK